MTPRKVGPPPGCPALRSIAAARTSAAPPQGQGRAAAPRQDEDVPGNRSAFVFHPVVVVVVGKKQSSLWLMSIIASLPSHKYLLITYFLRIDVLHSSEQLHPISPPRNAYSEDFFFLVLRFELGTLHLALPLEPYLQLFCSSCFSARVLLFPWGQPA
jgi:hypothetical protein